MYIAILGRQPALGMAELERLYGAQATTWFGDMAATVNDDAFDFERLGGTQKAGRVVAELSGDWRKVSIQLVRAYAEAWADASHKITLGISAYGFDVSARDVQKTGIILKKKLREFDVSLRLIPNTDPALNTATSHHNKLGLSDNKVELIVVRASGGRVIIAESVGSQNITALAARDQDRPKRDAFVGMLPPKLARMMVNLTGVRDVRSQTILDPFCGTGVLLQEAMLLGANARGSDLAAKMVDYTRENLAWLVDKYHLSTSFDVELGDAMTYQWQLPIDAVACETYLGQPFSAPPRAAKLEEVAANCNYIIGTFLENIHAQLEPGAPLCVAVPAWRSSEGSFTHLPVVGDLGKLGYQVIGLKHVHPEQLLYFREDQVVARELLLLVKK